MGYAPIAGYLGQEGRCLGFELREKTQHCQKETPGFLRRMIQAGRRVTKLPLLVRLDSGNDALENYALFQEAGVDFLAKHNWRREDPTVWEEKVRALQESAWTEPRKGKRVARRPEACERSYPEGECGAREIPDGGRGVPVWLVANVHWPAREGRTIRFPISSLHPARPGKMPEYVWAM